MEPKKILVSLLAMFSCLPMSNAIDDNTKKQPNSSPVNTNNVKDSINAKRFSKNEQLMKNDKPTEDKIYKSKNSSGINKFVASLIGTGAIGAGVGGTLLLQHFIKKNSLEKIPPEACSYLFTCVEMSKRYGKDIEKKFNYDPELTNYDKLITEYIYYGHDIFQPESSEITLFKSLCTLYQRIINSQEFKNLDFGVKDKNKIYDLGRFKTLKSIRENIVGIPKSVKIQDNKWKWEDMEQNKVYVNMPENFEITTDGSICDNENNKLHYCAIFSSDDNGDISLKTFSIGKI